MPQDVDVKELREGLRAIRAIVERLEGRLESSEETPDPYERRKAILNRIYWATNNVAREELLGILREHGTQYQWIGQQVKKGYLSVLPLPGGGVRYSVTPRAVRELGLGQEAPVELEEAAALAKLSEPSFAEEWDSPEDSIYDEL
ncbi:MAG: hypothetical protein ACUVV3_08125 [Dehalococcoidia bacterium]